MKLHNTKEALQATNADLSASQFNDVNLQEATFTNVNLSRVRFTDINLSERSDLALPRRSAMHARTLTPEGGT